MSACETGDRILHQFLRATQCQLFVPGEGISGCEWKWRVAGDPQIAEADDRVAGVEGAIAFVEEREMPVQMPGCFDNAERSVEFDLGERSRYRRLNSPECS